MACNSKNIDFNEQDFVVPTSLIIKSTACLIICLFVLFFYKFSIKNRFLYKKIFFLLHLLQVQQHMMMMMARGDGGENGGDCDA